LNLIFDINQYLSYTKVSDCFRVGFESEFEFKCYLKLKSN
jgi:hypothetical protein